MVKVGKDAAPLVPAPTLGLARPLVIVVEASRTAKKRARRWPRVRLAANATLTSASPGASRRALVLSELTVAESKAFDATMIEGLRGNLQVGPDPIELVSDGHAAVTALPWPASTDAKPTEIGHAVKHALSHLTLPLPTDPVGRNGRLEIRREVELMGLPMQQTLTLKVDQVHGKQIELSGDVTYSLDPSAGTSAALGVAAVNRAHGKGKFRLRLHGPSATPIEMKLTVALVVAGPGGEQKAWLNLSVDEDYLATPDRRVRFVGEFTQGGLVIGHVPPKTKVWFRKRRTKVSDKGDFVVGLQRKAKERARLSFQFPGAEVERHIVQVAQREFVDERIDGLPPEMVDLDRTGRRALAKSKRRLKKLRNKTTREPYFAGGFKWPLKGKITSTYGRERYLNGEAKGPHWGVDIAAPVGKPVKAPAGGVVVLAEHEVPLSGSLMVIDHGHGLTSAFLHLQKFKVEVGDVVTPGQVIATAGNSGRTTGPHLDWRMNLHETRVDPETIVGRR